MSEPRTVDDESGESSREAIFRAEREAVVADAEQPEVLEEAGDWEVGLCQ
ncbi:MAG: hypothetical protein ACSLFI_12725 [Solirubrobacterales bacterium]